MFKNLMLVTYLSYKVVVEFKAVIIASPTPLVFPLENLNEKLLSTKLNKIDTDNKKIDKHRLLTSDPLIDFY